ncbi:transporter substrate-binding domain-containing protein [Synechococcus sp. Tobar12-5m-g]|uniref:substrate-binding periplasmic protein n=1 Tax=unclassified Synechococcus TaxID=2626047 RepID=UPI0020CFE58B|nr:MULTISPECIES: transporter substrate-binding domain-containing protein [unclassified Synechococcus]MCP9772620.1 transporter substrate-binding domain-containing protein [Synechococcus sp. Tobar12-5m-g]MCP9873524.1 transporter substrate-binding domain-containing protein [Synechococcus sp. Cruz CV-v-12]
MPCLLATLRNGALLAFSLVALGLPGQANPVLRVGVTDGSQPCNFRDGGSWRGIAVDLWSRIATEEGLPYVIQAQPDTATLLEAVERGDLDIAVGCLNVSPERLQRFRFTLPFQEEGQAVLVRRSRLDVGRATALALLSPDLLRLLGGFLMATAVVTVALWRIEGLGHHPSTERDGRRRSFAKMFQILATGPGTNTVAVTTRGHALVLVSYLIRIVSASLLVSFVTLNVVRQPQFGGQDSIRSLDDLAGKRVGARRGSVSEELLRSLNRGSSRAAVEILPLQTIEQAGPLLLSKRADAVLADDLQLQYLSQQLSGSRFDRVLRGIRPESQAFALGPALPEAIAERIDRRISAFKRNGVVAELRRNELSPP